MKVYDLHKDDLSGALRTYTRDLIIDKIKDSIINYKLSVLDIQTIISSLEEIRDKYDIADLSDEFLANIDDLDEKLQIIGKGHMTGYSTCRLFVSIEELWKEQNKKDKC